MTKKELDKIAKEQTLMCPFCPVHPKIEERYLYKTEYVMFCPKCGLTMKGHDLETLIKKWNTRYYPEGIFISESDMQALTCTLYGLLNPVMDKIKVTESILDNVHDWLMAKRRELKEEKNEYRNETDC